MTITAKDLMNMGFDQGAEPGAAIGTIPVGRVVVAENAIHLGMHSADIRCSLMVSEFKDSDPGTLLDAVHKVTHFGPGGRPNGQRFTLKYAP